MQKEVDPRLSLKRKKAAMKRWAKATPKDRSEAGRRGGEALASWWATATPEQREKHRRAVARGRRRALTETRSRAPSKARRRAGSRASA